MRFYNSRYKKLLKASSLVDLLKIQEITVNGREVGYLTKAAARQQAIAKRKHARAISRGLKKAHREKRRTKAMLADLAKGRTPASVQSRIRRSSLGLGAKGPVLAAAMADRHWLKAAEIAERVGMHVKMVHPTLSVMCRIKFVEKIGSCACMVYRLTDLGAAFDWGKIDQNQAYGDFEGVPVGAAPADARILCTLDFVAWRTTPELREETGLTQSRVRMTRLRLKKAGLIEVRGRYGGRKVRRDEPRLELRLTEAGLRYCAALAVMIGDRPRSIEGFEGTDSELRERIMARLREKRRAGAVRMWADPALAYGAERRRAALADSANQAKRRAACERMWDDPEYRKRHAEWSRRSCSERKEQVLAMFALGHTPAVRAKAAVGIKASWDRVTSEERAWRARGMLRANKKRVISEEQRKQISETLKARWAGLTPAQRRLQIKGLRGMASEE